MSMLAEARATRDWWAIGLLVRELNPDEVGVPLVAEALVPEGASPALHMHRELDDSFYIVDGKMVLRCGDDVWVGRRGDWIPFPKMVPHTFRVMDGPAQILMVHANDSFISAVRELGSVAERLELPPARPGPSQEELDRVLEAHGMVTVGGYMEEDEARDYLIALGEK